MKLKPGDRLDVSTNGDRIVMTRSTLTFDRLTNFVGQYRAVAQTA